MLITHGREHVINLGQYESFRSSASIQTEYDVANDDWNELIKNLSSRLDDVMRNDLKEAEKLTDVRNSYVITWNAEREK